MFEHDWLIKAGFTPWSPENRNNYHTTQNETKLVLDLYLGEKQLSLGSDRHQEVTLPWQETKEGLLDLLYALKFIKQDEKEYILIVQGLNVSGKVLLAVAADCALDALEIGVKDGHITKRDGRYYSGSRRVIAAEWVKGL